MPSITNISANHHRATVDEIEKARLKDVDHGIRRLISMPGVHEAMVLQTCNRVEIYALCDDAETLKKFAACENMPCDVMHFKKDDEALIHLLRLSCGLESMIIGEDQILGQLKASYLLSEKNGAIGEVLSTAVLKAINAGKRARQETRINKGSVSIGSAAVDLAESILGELHGRTILVVGAGEMGTLVANALAEKSLKGVYVANRTFEHAEQLAAELGGKAVKLDDIGDYICSADVVICATSAPHLIITKKMLEQILVKCCDKKLLIIDITNPRNVEETVSEIPGVELHNIDSLRRISDANMEKRRSEIVQVEAIIDDEFDALKREFKRQRVDSVISDIYQKADSIRLIELNRAISRLSSNGGISEKQARIISEFSQALAGKLLSGPVRKLRLAAEKSDEDYLRVAQELFDLLMEESDELSYSKAAAVKTE
jgi:glutamyl-tRNA reductase